MSPAPPVRRGPGTRRRAQPTLGQLLVHVRLRCDQSHQTLPCHVAASAPAASSIVHCPPWCTELASLVHTLLQLYQYSPKTQGTGISQHVPPPLACNLLPRLAVMPASPGRGASCDTGRAYTVFLHAGGTGKETSTMQAKGQYICLGAGPL